MYIAAPFAAAMLLCGEALADTSDYCADFFDNFENAPMLGEEAGAVRFLTEVDKDCAEENLRIYGDRFANVLIDNGILEYFSGTNIPYLSEAMYTYYTSNRRPLYLGEQVFSRMLDQADQQIRSEPEDANTEVRRAVHFIGVGYNEIRPALEAWEHYDPGLASLYETTFTTPGAVQCTKNDDCPEMPENYCSVSKIADEKYLFRTSPENIWKWMRSCNFGIGNITTFDILDEMRRIGVLDARCSETIQYNAILSNGFTAAQNCDSLLASLSLLSSVSSTDMVELARYGDKLVQIGRLSEKDYQNAARYIGIRKGEK